MSSTEIATASFAGIPVAAASNDVIVAHILCAAKNPPQHGLHVHLLAGHSVVMAHQDRAFWEVLHSGGVVIPDGRWLEILTKKDRQHLTQLRGHDLLQRVTAEGVDSSIRHFFLGASTEVLQELRGALERRVPGLEWAGSEVYPFDELDASSKDELAKWIAQTQPHIVWMGISSPRQDKEAFWLAEALGVPVICVGAALEFEAGVQKLAPRWMRRMGFEWLFRFAQQPGRLFRRYVLGSLLFLWLVMRYRLLSKPAQ